MNDYITPQLHSHHNRDKKKTSSSDKKNCLLMGSKMCTHIPFLKMQQNNNIIAWQQIFCRAHKILPTIDNIFNYFKQIHNIQFRAPSHNPRCKGLKPGNQYVVAMVVELVGQKWESLPMYLLQIRRQHSLKNDHLILESRPKTDNESS